MLLVRNKRLRLLCGAMETFNLLALRLWLKNPARARKFCGCIFRQYVYLAGGDRWRSSSIDALFPQNRGRRIVLENSPNDGLDSSIAELAYLALITASLEPRCIFEIGTFRGRTALNFALNSPADATVYTLDLSREERSHAARSANAFDEFLIGHSDPGLYCRGKEVARKICQLYGNSMQFDFSPYFGKVDLVFVDGAHHAAAARSDTRNALKMVRDGGWIVWHDFGNYGDYHDVTRVVLELIPPREVIQIESTQFAVYHKPASHPAPGP